MSNLTERANYLKGLADGLQLNTEKSSTRLLLEVIDLLSDMADEIEALQADHEELSDFVDAIDEDLGLLEEDVADLEDGPDFQPHCKKHPCCREDSDEEDFGDYEVYTKGDFKYTRENGCTIVGYTGNKANLVIPDTLDGYDVKAIGDNRVFMNNKTLRTVKLGSEITYIGDCAFYGCSNITDVTLSPNLKQIYVGAFMNCSSLKTIEIPASLCTKNGMVNAGPGWGDGVFAGCNNLSTVTFAKGSKVIPDDMFYNCDGLKSITIPNSVTTIGSEAFYDCDGLTDVNMGKGVTTINSEAFRECDKLVNVTFSPKLTKVGSWAFRNCPSFIKVNLPASLCSKNAQSKEMFRDDKNLTTVSFGKGSTFIPEGAFNNCDSIKSITLPDSMTEIKALAFYDCDGLTTLNMGKGVKTVGKAAYYSCDKLNNIKF